MALSIGMNQDITGFFFAKAHMITLDPVFGGVGQRREFEFFHFDSADEAHFEKAFAERAVAANAQNARGLARCEVDEGGCPEVCIGHGDFSFSSEWAPHRQRNQKLSRDFSAVRAGL